MPHNPSPISPWGSPANRLEVTVSPSPRAKAPPAVQRGRLAFGVRVLLVSLLAGSAALALDNGVALTPPMGWNPWNSFDANFNETTAKQMIDVLISSGLRDAGYNYFNLDAWGDHYGTDPTADFPSGMVAFGAYVHAHGFKFGVYGNRNAVHGHETEWAQRWALWQADFVKYDIWDVALTDATFPALRDAIAATGRPMVISLHGSNENNPPANVATLANMWRTNTDVCTPNQSSWAIPNTFNLMANLDGNAPLFALAGPGHWNDADMLVVGIPPELSDGEKRAHFSLWCVMASPLLIGCDLRSANATTLAVLKNAEAIAVDQDPLGFQGRKISDDGSHEIFAKAMSDGSMAIVLFNRGAATATMTINWSSLGFQGAMTVRDLWQHQDLGSLANGYSTTVPSHDAAMLRLFPNANTTSTAVTISGLTASSDGLPHPVTVTTTPPGQTVVVTYNGSTTVPTSPGTYTVVATINDANATHMGSATGVMVIAGTDEGKRRCGTGVGFAILSLFSFMLLPLRRSRWR